MIALIVGIVLFGTAGESRSQDRQGSIFDALPAVLLACLALDFYLGF